VNLLGDNIKAIKNITLTLIDASKGFGLEVNTEELSICCRYYRVLTMVYNTQRNVVFFHCYLGKIRTMDKVRKPNISVSICCSLHQTAEQNHDIKIGNRRFEYVAQFRYLGTTIRNQNLIQEEIKRKLNTGNACYHSVINLLSSSSAI
jgi:hypothetical protein